jgi:RNA polymerase sigma-70 factor (ECF subfamily)
MSTGEIKTIETFFKLHYRNLVSYAYVVVQDTLVAEDLVMELFLNLWEKHGTNLNKIKYLKAYHYKALYINSCNYLKEKNRIEISCLNYCYQNSQVETIEPDSTIPPPSKIRDLVKELSPPRKQVIELYYFNGLTLEKIASRLNIPLNTVISHKRRAEAAMKKTLQETT